jgi:hypothetical protein
MKVMLNLIEFFVLRVRFTNPFLFTVGTALGLGNFFFGGGFITSFCFGLCFGLIALNYIEEKQRKNNG